MATTKKTHTTKKTTAKKAPSKSVSAKKGSKAVKARPLTWRFYAVTIGIFLVAVASVLVIALFTSNVIAKNTAKARLDRINDIYSSINVGEGYVPTSINVFGDKRPYDWGGDFGKGRTYSSAIYYTHGDTVSNTVADLDQKIKAAGFEKFDEPYPGSTSIQYHYKSAKGESVRLTVSSKPYNDAWSNATAMKQEVPESVYAMDKNAGPSSVILKVNLDDNNE